MGRQSSDSAMVGSSIALLQERFRQLERVREKREEQQLLKLFMEPEKMVSPSPATRFDGHKIFPVSPPAQDRLSLRLSSPSKVSDLWPTGGAIASQSLSIGSSEVDTSLHL